MKKILVVDDSSFMRDMISGIILKAGDYEIIEAVNGDEAVQKYREYAPQAVFMDIVMESKDGITALKDIRAIDNDAIIVIVSVLGHDAMKQKAKEAGAQHFIMKPFQETEVVDILKRIFPGNVPA